MVNRVSIKEVVSATDGKPLYYEVVEQRNPYDTVFGPRFYLQVKELADARVLRDIINANANNYLPTVKIKDIT